MRLTVTTDTAAVTAECVIEILTRALRERGRAVFIGSAGQTPTPTYEYVVSHYANAIDWSKVVVVQMDEYTGVGHHHPDSLAAYLREHLVEPLNVGRFVPWNDRRGQQMASFATYADLARNPDLVLHGIGCNGHVGFNEPPSLPSSTTRCVTLAESTIRHNVAGRGAGVTLGLDVLRTARHTVLLATGEAKAAAVSAAVQGPPSPTWPASWLRDLPNYRVILDPAAAGGLEDATG